MRLPKPFVSLLLVFLVFSCAPATAAYAQTPGSVPGQRVRVAIVGLVHGHVQGLLSALPNSDSAELVAIVEANHELSERYAARYHLPSKLFHPDLERMLTEQHPDAVLVYTSIRDHRSVIERAAMHGVSSMVEKPLATTLEDAVAIRDIARKQHVDVLVNYETTWYSSNAEALNEVREGKLGNIRKVTVHDGHEGPKEIGVGPEWLPWLTDPVEAGAGALFDFGCYGADLLTVLMKGEIPLSVTAVIQTDKPGIYAHVDDDATVILRYPGAQAVLMPSWNWSFARKDMEVYGDKGSLVTMGADQVEVRYRGEKQSAKFTAPSLPIGQRDSLSYLAAVLHRQVDNPNDLSGIDTNVIVMQILSAARESARSGRTIELHSLP